MVWPVVRARLLSPWLAARVLVCCFSDFNLESSALSSLITAELDDTVFFSCGFSGVVTADTVVAGVDGEVPRKLLASCFFARVRASWKVVGGSSRILSNLMPGKRPFSKVAVMKTSHACSCGLRCEGAERAASARRRVRACETWRAYESTDCLSTCLIVAISRARTEIRLGAENRKVKAWQYSSQVEGARGRISCPASRRAINRFSDRHSRVPSVS